MLYTYLHKEQRHNQKCKRRMFKAARNTKLLALTSRIAEQTKAANGAEIKSNRKRFDVSTVYFFVCNANRLVSANIFIVLEPCLTLRAWKVWPSYDRGSSWETNYFNISKYCYSWAWGLRINYSASNLSLELSDFGWFSYIRRKFRLIGLLIFNWVF